METQKSKSTATKVVVLSPEEFQKLTQEEQVAYLNAINQQTADLQNKNAELSALVNNAVKADLPTFDVEEDKEHDIEGGTYQFTCPSFHWDDNSIIDVRELMAAAEGKDAKLAEKAQAIVSALVARKSGIVARKED